MREYTFKKCIRFDSETEQRLKKLVSDYRAKYNCKISESEFMRNLIYRDMIENIGINKNEFLSLNRNIAGACNNLNQIAHHVNSGFITVDDRVELENCISKIFEMKILLNQIIKILYN